MRDAGALLTTFLDDPHDPRVARQVADRLLHALEHRVDLHLALGVPTLAESRRRLRDDILHEVADMLDVDPAVRPGKRQSGLDRRVAALLVAVRDFHSRLPAWEQHGGPPAFADETKMKLWRAERWMPIPRTRQGLKAILSRM